MRFTVNGEQREAPASLSVEALLGELDLAGRPCAVEVNREVVPRRRHADHAIRDGDSVEIVTLVGGG
ncbi:MAG: sulfur carrier protein ThiS [Planctomycetota bacterium]|nr:sulfur carrier protein ThiS [Planctomycetota bacterium]